MRRVWIALILGSALLAVAGGSFSPWRQAETWQQLASPGPLSTAHASLAGTCTACHTSVIGIEAVKCITCHANNTALLQRQPTAFHADMTSCRDCHIEHRGVHRRPSTMEHRALTKIGLRQLTDGDTVGHARNAELRTHLVQWIKEQRNVGHSTASVPQVTPEESVLQCVTCHANEDRHGTLFGAECAQCHGTTKWAIAEFRHPSPRSLECAQCHQAPPSHYMMHFEMVSKKVAGLDNEQNNQCCGPVQVNQCYRCHQTTAWNDIKGVGWYKHH